MQKVSHWDNNGLGWHACTNAKVDGIGDDIS